MEQKMYIRNNLIGNKYGKLLVLDYIPRSLHKRTKYKCVCDCGNEVIVEGSKLKNGHTKSCGCIRKEIFHSYNTKKYGEANKNALIISYKSNAKRKGLEFNLTNEELEILFKSNCFYCGSKPKSIMNRPKTNGPYQYNGIDRKDNNIGYIKENVVPCCSQCNYVKNSFNYDEFIEWITIVHANLKKNNIIH